MQMKVWSVVYNQDAENGSTTTVELVNESTFGKRFPDATKGDIFDQSATPAQPEALT